MRRCKRDLTNCRELSFGDRFRSGTANHRRRSEKGPHHRNEHGLVVPAIVDVSVVRFEFSLIVEGDYVVRMRLEPAKVSLTAYHAMLGLERVVSNSTHEP